jgi:hypothetical protein
LKQAALDALGMEQVGWLYDIYDDDDKPTGGSPS